MRARCGSWRARSARDARRELERLEACAGAARVRIRRLEGGALPQPPKNVGCIIDALFGTGLSRPLAGVPLALCRLVNAAEGVPVVAVDIPSGLNGDTGEVMGEAVRADETVTFHRPKPGLYLREGPDYAAESSWRISVSLPRWTTPRLAPAGGKRFGGAAARAQACEP